MAGREASVSEIVPEIMKRCSSDWREPRGKERTQLTLLSPSEKLCMFVLFPSFVLTSFFECFFRCSRTMSPIPLPGDPRRLLVRPDTPPLLPEQGTPAVPWQERRSHRGTLFHGINFFVEDQDRWREDNAMCWLIEVRAELTAKLTHSHMRESATATQLTQTSATSS